MRKRTLEFDDVMNKQRQVIYEYRNEALNTDETRALLYETLDQGIPEKVKQYLIVEDGVADADSLVGWVNITFPVQMKRSDLPEDTRDIAGFSDKIIAKIKATYELKAATETPESLRELERYMVLGAIDRLWQEHLYGMDSLRDGVHLQQMAQKDPLVEYKKSAYEMFSALMGNINSEVMQGMFRTTTDLKAYEQLLEQLMGGEVVKKTKSEPPKPQQPTPQPPPAGGGSRSFSGPPSGVSGVSFGGGGTFTASSGGLNLRPVGKPKAREGG
jgi:preprotein translocase subunit SecA